MAAGLLDGKTPGRRHVISLDFGWRNKHGLGALSLDDKRSLLAGATKSWRCASGPTSPRR